MILFHVKEVNNVELMALVGLYSLSLSFCVILFIGVYLGFPKSCC